MGFAVTEPCLSRGIGKRGCQGKGDESVACNRIANCLVPTKPNMPCACFVHGDGSDLMEATAGTSQSQLESVSSQPRASHSPASFT